MVKVKAMVKVISNLIFSAFVKFVIKIMGYHLKNRIWPDLTLEVMAKVTIG